MSHLLYRADAVRRLHVLTPNDETYEARSSPGLGVRGRLEGKSGREIVESSAEARAFVA